MYSSASQNAWVMETLVGLFSFGFYTGWEELSAEVEEEKIRADSEICMRLKMTETTAQPSDATPDPSQYLAEVSGKGLLGFLKLAICGPLKESIQDALVESGCMSVLNWGALQITKYTSNQTTPYCTTSAATKLPTCSLSASISSLLVQPPLESYESLHLPVLCRASSPPSKIHSLPNFHLNTMSADPAKQTLGGIPLSYISLITVWL
jgi:hypothetical protein